LVLSYYNNINIVFILFNILVFCVSYINNIWILKNCIVYIVSHINPVLRKLYEDEFLKLKLSFKERKIESCHKCDVVFLKIYFLWFIFNIPIIILIIDWTPIKIPNKIGFTQDLWMYRYSSWKIDHFDLTSFAFWPSTKEYTLLKIVNHTSRIRNICGMYKYITYIIINHYMDDQKLITFWCQWNHFKGSVYL